jgi:hypothetical protein
MEHGRNLFKLSEAMTRDSPYEVEDAKQLLEDATIYLRLDKPDAATARSEEAFKELIDIFRR